MAKTKAYIRTISGMQSAKVEADANPADIEALIEYASRVSTVSNSVRQGTTVSLGNVQAVSTTG